MRIKYLDKTSSWGCTFIVNKKIGKTVGYISCVHGYSFPNVYEAVEGKIGTRKEETFQNGTLCPKQRLNFLSTFHKTFKVT